MIAGILSALCLAAMPLVAQSPDMFKDVNRPHWAYSAADQLYGIAPLRGYPLGHFAGKRVLTRYEFGVAIDHFIRDLEDLPSTDDPAFELSLLDHAEQLQTETATALLQLVKEFRAELNEVSRMISRVQSNPWGHPPPSNRTAIGGRYTRHYVTVDPLFPETETSPARSRFRFKLGLLGEPP